MGSTYLTTPNWPDGMMPSSSVTWAVLIPQDYRAELVFTNFSQPKCASGHAVVEIRPLDSQKIESWREDQPLPPMVTQQQSFYLNMSNCEPKSGRFAVLSKITLQRETSKQHISHLILMWFRTVGLVFLKKLCLAFLHTGKFLGIILATVGILLLLPIIALIVICVIRKWVQFYFQSSCLFIKCYFFESYTWPDFILAFFCQEKET